jgi:hypothetical protein
MTDLSRLPTQGSIYLELALKLVASVPSLCSRPNGNVFLVAQNLAAILEDNAEKYLAAYEQALYELDGPRDEDKRPPDILRMDRWTWSCTTTYEFPQPDEDDH